MKSKPFIKKVSYVSYPGSGRINGWQVLFVNDEKELCSIDRIFYTYDHAKEILSEARTYVKEISGRYFRGFTIYRFKELADGPFNYKFGWVNE